MTNAPSVDQQLEILRRMVLTRRLEERLGELHRVGRTRGPLHRCDGQEAIGVAATAMLRESDLITSTHRGHAHYLGKGLTPYEVAAEIFGRESGACGGRAGHMLVANAKKGLLGGNAIVGASIPAAAGMALSLSLLNRDDIAMCFFGDGAAQTGICHETMNIAALWRLPLVMILEHNEYGLTVHHSEQSSVPDLGVRGAGYGIPSTMIDGNDAVAVYREVEKAVARARRGEGPTLIEAKTYRLEGFSTSDMGGYQDPAIIAQWKKRDPLLLSREALSEFCDASALDRLESSARAEMDDAIERALSAAMPSFSFPEEYSAYCEA